MRSREGADRDSGRLICAQVEGTTDHRAGRRPGQRSRQCLSRIDLQLIQVRMMCGENGAAGHATGRCSRAPPAACIRDESAGWRWREQTRAAVLLRIWLCNCPSRSGAPKVRADPRPSRALLPPPRRVHMHGTGSFPPESHRQQSSPVATKVKIENSSLDRPFDNPAVQIATPLPETRCAHLIRFHIP